MQKPAVSKKAAGSSFRLLVSLTPWISKRRTLAVNGEHFPGKLGMMRVKVSFVFLELGSHCYHLPGTWL